MKSWWVALDIEASDLANTDEQYKRVVRSHDQEGAISTAKLEGWSKGFNTSKTYAITIGEVPEGFEFD